jgi:hypothetical protein
MTTDFDFDARLRARLERLDAAIPAPAQPVIVAGPVVAATAPQPRSRGRRRKLVPLLAAAALLLAASVVTAQRFLYPDTPEPKLEAALGEVLADGDGCLSAAEARPAIQAKLDELGYADWDIVARQRADEQPCVTAGLLVPEHSVLLFPASGEQLADAFEVLAAELLERCLNRTEAMALVSSVLISHGITDLSVHADPWGPQGGPIDQFDAYKQHVADGCFVYVGMGRNGDGRPDYYLWGPWP